MLKTVLKTVPVGIIFGAIISVIAYLSGSPIGSFVYFIPLVTGALCALGTLVASLMTATSPREI